MGNRLVVKKPYIIDYYPSDDDDGTEEDDDGDCYYYESAHDGPDGPKIGVGSAAKDSWRETGEVSSANQNQKSDMLAQQGQQISLDSKIVSHLVKEVEKLLSFLENNDFESAQRAARIISGSQGRRVFAEEEQSLLPESQQGSTQLEVDYEEADKALGTEEESQHLLSAEESAGETTEATTVSVNDEEWSKEERLALAKLDEDLNQFEEDESRIITNSQHEFETQPDSQKREKGSFIPTFRKVSGNKSTVIEAESNSLPVNGDKVFEPSISRESRSRVSAIPRFSASTSVEEEAVQQELGSFPNEVIEQDLNEEKQEIIEAIVNNESEIASASNVLSSEQEDEELSPVSREIKVVIEGQNSDDDLIKVTDTSAWEINISDFTGRARRNKKRSGIPSLWTEQSNKTSAKTSPEVASKSQTSVPSSPETTTSSPKSPSPKTSESESSDSTTSKGINLDLDANNPGQRKILDLKRWMCISRPQYKTSCGISSVVSCWNMLFSTLGHGSLSPLTQEQAIRILGFKGPFEKLRFGPFTGNLTLLRWFRELNNHFRVRGRCYIMFKPNGRNRTIGVTDKIALEKLKAGLQDPGTVFIYHCHNHYFCPIGYEDSPSQATEAYSGKVPSESINHTWFLIGDTSRKYGPFHCKSWEEICQDLHMNYPEYFNIRKSWLGVLKKKGSRKTSGNLHCIMCFQKPKDLQSLIPSAQTNKTSIPKASRLPRRSPSPSSRRSGEGEFRFGRNDREVDTDEDWDEEVENLTSDVSSDDENVRRKK